ncbi:beta-1,3-galactosyltransferase 5-like [Clavelina lepadiformis]|uniref:beta-1,3-galactosyltransferase 5-like n=1 Tax=Clavelina lepadiformis TaxID=159417 RepID=UPI00404236A4
MRIKIFDLGLMFVTACLCYVGLRIVLCGQVTKRSFNRERVQEKNTNSRTGRNLNEVTGTNQSPLIPNNHGIEFLIYPNIEYSRKHYTTMNDATCKDRDPSWAMVTFVKSAARNIEHRKLLRRTWASLGKIDQSNFYTVFVIGKPNGSLQDTIQEEIRLHRDILQMSTPEDYQFIGMKTLAGMKWAAENLPPNFYYSTSDDDMWIDMLKVKEWIDEYRTQAKKGDWPEFPIICTYKWWNGSLEPIRTPTDKNYVSKEQYPWPYWPAFCFGGMYTTSVSVIKQLWELSTISRPLLYNADDVWITGLLRHKIGMPDEMLIRPKEHAAKHYRGFASRGATVKYEVNFIEWKDALKQLQNRSLCRW